MPVNTFFLKQKTFIIALWTSPWEFHQFTLVKEASQQRWTNPVALSRTSATRKRRRQGARPSMLRSWGRVDFCMKEKRKRNTYTSVLHAMSCCKLHTGQHSISYCWVSLGLKDSSSAAKVWKNWQNEVIRFTVWRKMKVKIYDNGVLLLWSLFFSSIKN